MNEKLEEKIVYCNKLEDLSIINSFQRGNEYIVVFGEKIKTQKETIVNKWNKLSEFLILIHSIEPKIKVVKLITDKEIEENQELLEKYARDYKELSTKLIYQLADKFNLKIEEPVIKVFGSLKLSDYRSGVMGKWRYIFHGIDCCFTNIKTEQCIETPLSFGNYFGKLEPFFFVRYIDSTPNYKPLKVQIYNGYHDGRRILDKMVELGRFERIRLENGNEGIVVKSRK